MDRSRVTALQPPLAVAFVFLCAALAPLYAEMQAGAAKARVTPSLEKHAPVYIAGYGMNRVATGVRDDLWARCLAVALTRPDGQETLRKPTPLVLCSVDLIGLFLEDTEQIRELVSKRLDRRVLVTVAATHNHEGIDTMGLWGPSMGRTGVNEAYNQWLIEEIARVAVEAVEAMRPARIRLAKSDDPELDTFIDDSRPPVVHDSELLVLSATGTDGKPIATLVNWSNHPEALGSKNTLITSDYLDAFYRRVESVLGGTAVFMNGALGGMQSPGDASISDPRTGKSIRTPSFEKADLLGRRVADFTIDALKRNSEEVDIDRIVMRRNTVQLPLENEGFRMAAAAGVFGKRSRPIHDNAITTSVGYIALYQKQKPVLEIALIPGEMYPELSVGGVKRYEGADYPEAPIEPAIKSLFRAPYKMLFGLADDEIGYIIPKAEWDARAPWLQNAPKSWYGEINSPGPETAPLIAAEFEQLMKEQ
jgi:hypothetical protein